MGETGPPRSFTNLLIYAARRLILSEITGICFCFWCVGALSGIFYLLMSILQMTSSGICSITPESIAYMHNALLPKASNPEAASHFTRLIEESLKTKFTQFNFFLHNLAQNLAQLKFTTDNQSDTTLSFVPKMYR